MALLRSRAVFRPGTHCPLRAPRARSLTFPVARPVLTTIASRSQPSFSRAVHTETSDLAHFVSTLTYDALPPSVVSRTKELFADWVPCALAGRGYSSLVALEKFATAMGPPGGRCEVLAPSMGSQSHTSPYFAAMLNAAAGHIVEQDDLHNTSVVHPATVVFPAALAASQDLGSSGKDFLLASVVGYEVACRVGEMLGTSHYRIFHTTGTAGTLGASASASLLLHLSPSQTLDALGTAGTQAAGLWEFATDAAMSKQVHTAHAAGVGVMSAWTAREGLRGARDVLLGARGMARGMGVGGEWRGERLVRGLGREWKVEETSFKYWASCRHTHPSADALLKLLTEHTIPSNSISSITAHVYRAALDVLGPCEAARTVHESKFSMAFVLSVMATKRSALLRDFGEEVLGDEEVRGMMPKVQMVWDEAIEKAYPERWLGHVEVETTDGRRFEQRVEAVKGDPDNTLSREEIMVKGRSLAPYGGSAFVGERLEKFFEDVWKLDERETMRGLLE